MSLNNWKQAKPLWAVHIYHKIITGFYSAKTEKENVSWEGESVFFSAIKTKTYTLQDKNNMHIKLI